ncbi:hypothetical protein SprV_0401452300 [Sparganum proliferum]
MNAKQSGPINTEAVNSLLIPFLNYVGSETIPASSAVAVVTSSTAAAKTTTTAAVGTNAIKEVATLTFSPTSSVHGADFAITNPTTNVPLSAGLGGVQTIDATTTALPTAATLGHPDTPNATQSAADKVVVRTGTPTTTSTTTATRMVDLEAGGSSSNCRRVHTSVSDAVPRPLPRPLPHSVSAPNRIDCVAIAVAVVAETLNPTDITAGTLVSADPFHTTFPSTVSNPRGVEGVESIANINPILLITRPVGNVYLVSTIVTLPAAGAVHATVTADDDADAAVIAATTPIHFAEENLDAGGDCLLRYIGSETIPASSPVAAVTSSTAAATTTTTAAVGTNAIKEVATLTFSTTSSDHGADFAITNPTTNVPLSAGLGGVQTIDATTTTLPTATTLGHPDNPNATQSAAAKVVVRTGTPTTTSTTTATRMVDLEAGGDSSNCRRVHASVSDAVPRPLPHSVSAPNRIDCVAVTVAVVAETLNPTDITAGTLVSADPFPTTFPFTVSNPRGVEGVESIANINPILLITRPVGNVYLVSTIVTLPAAGAVEDVDATDTGDDADDHDDATPPSSPPPPLFISRISPAGVVGFLRSHLSETRGSDLPLRGGGDSPRIPLTWLLQTGVSEKTEMRWTQTSPVLDSGDGVVCVQPTSKEKKTSTLEATDCHATQVVLPKHIEEMAAPPELPHRL